MECFAFFSCFITFEVNFFFFFNCKDYRVLHNMDYRKGTSFLLSFFVLLSCLKSYCFLLFLWDSYSSGMLLLVSFEMHFFSLGIICKNCLCLSIFSLMFGRVLWNFNTSEIFDLFVIFGFEVNKAFLVTFDILLN